MEELSTQYNKKLQHHNSEVFVYTLYTQTCPDQLELVAGVPAFDVVG